MKNKFIMIIDKELSNSRSIAQGKLMQDYWNQATDTDITSFTGKFTEYEITEYANKNAIDICIKEQGLSDSIFTETNRYRVLELFAESK